MVFFGSFEAAPTALWCNSSACGARRGEWNMRFHSASQGNYHTSKLHDGVGRRQDVARVEAPRVVPIQPIEGGDALLDVLAVDLV